MKQIMIPIEDEPGAASDVTGILGAVGINIETFNTRKEDDHGILILTVDQYDLALQTLRDHGYDAISEDAIVVRLKDEPGALARVFSRFKEANINLRSARIVRRQGPNSLVAIVPENHTHARDLLKDLLVE